MNGLRVETRARMLTMEQTGWEMVGAVAAYFAGLKCVTIGTPTPRHTTGMWDRSRKTVEMIPAAAAKTVVSGSYL